MRKLLFKQNGDIRYLVLIKIVALIAIFYVQLTEYLETNTATISQASGLILSFTVILIIIQIMIYSFFFFTSIYESFNRYYSKDFYRYKVKTRYSFKNNTHQPYINKKVEQRTYLSLNVIRC